MPGTRCGAFGAATGTIYVSTDHGATWAPVPNTGGVYSGAGRTTLAVAATGDSIVYALAETENTAAQKDLFRSTDGGLNWTALGVNSTKTGSNGLINPNPEQPNMNLLGVQAYYNQLIVVDPSDAARHTVYLGGALSTAKTTNGGANWRILSNSLAQFGLSYVHSDHHAAAIVPGGRVLSGTDGGLSVSTDGGLSWSTEKNNGLQTFLFHSIAGTPVFPNAVFGGAQDNGTRVREGNSTSYNQTIGGDGMGAGWSEDGPAIPRWAAYRGTKFRPARAAISTASPRSRRHGSNRPCRSDSRVTPSCSARRSRCPRRWLTERARCSSVAP